MKNFLVANVPEKLRVNSKDARDRMKTMIDELLARKLSREDSIAFWSVQVPQSELAVSLPKAINDSYVSLLSDKEYRCQDFNEDAETDGKFKFTVDTLQIQKLMIFQLGLNLMRASLKFPTNLMSLAWTMSGF